MDNKKIINVIEDLSLEVEKCETIIDSNYKLALNDTRIESNIPVLLCVALDYIEIINKKIDDLIRLL